jgi:hypothetical protein
LAFIAFGIDVISRGVRIVELLIKLVSLSQTLKAVVIQKTDSNKLIIDDIWKIGSFKKKFIMVSGMFLCS